jgi:hypothetical protein
MDYAKAKEYELAGVKVEGTKFLDDRVLNYALRLNDWRKN